MPKIERKVQEKVLRWNLMAKKFYADVWRRSSKRKVVYYYFDTLCYSTYETIPSCRASSAEWIDSSFEPPGGSKKPRASHLKLEASSLEPRAWLEASTLELQAWSLELWFLGFLSVEHRALIPWCLDFIDWGAVSVLRCYTQGKLKRWRDMLRMPQDESENESEFADENFSVFPAIYGDQWRSMETM